MGRISSTVGLVTGIPIQQTVDQLIAIEARSRDLVVSRTRALEQQQVALSDLTAKLLTFQFYAKQLGDDSLFEQLTVTSSNSQLLAARITGDAVPGNYQYTPARPAQAQQLLSSAFLDDDVPLGAGSFSLGFGGEVDQGISLALLNGGEGVARGKIRITDRSGASADVDLSLARTIDDVIEAVNNASGVNVSLEARGDRLRLVDHTNQTASSLRVQEVSGGATAAGLGLAGIDVAADEADGSDVLRLYENLSLSVLNDGRGVRLHEALPDLEVTFQDGSATLKIDFHPLEGDDTPELTLGHVIATINEAGAGRLKAEIGPDGDRLVLTDLTDDLGGTFGVSAAFSSKALVDLGLDSDAAGGVLTGRRLQGGLRSTLLASLDGGRGLHGLGTLDITDRAGNSVAVDLSTAETLDDVVAAINDAAAAAPTPVQITVQINDTRSGLLLTDTSGSTSGPLVVSSGDETAERLGLVVDDNVASVGSGDLHRQTVSRQTRLDALNGGDGVFRGKFRITDSDGVGSTINVGLFGVETVGDVIDAINNAGADVEARINDTGDGILLVDTAGGDGQLRVTESGTGTTAADLRLLGTSEEIEIEGVPTKVIDGSGRLSVELDEDDTLDDLIDKLNALPLKINALKLGDGSAGNPFRISIFGQQTGDAANLRFDASGVDFSFQETAKAQDALLIFGGGSNGSGGLLVSSSDNKFDNLLPGVELTVGGASESPVTVSVAGTDKNLVSTVQNFVNTFNQLRDKLDELTFFNEGDSSTGVLFGSNEALRVETELAQLLSGRFFGAGDIQSLESLGISLSDVGKLSFDETKLRAAFASDPSAVAEFLGNDDRGVSAKMNALIETLAGRDNSLLVNRARTLGTKIDTNDERIKAFNVRLQKKRERLLLDFHRMELAIGKQQNNLTALNSLQILPPLQLSSGNR